MPTLLPCCHHYTVCKNSVRQTDSWTSALLNAPHPLQEDFFLFSVESQNLSIEVRNLDYCVTKLEYQARKLESDFSFLP